MGFTP